MAATAGSRSAACLKVPPVVAVAPSERGKSSYQAPYRARGRSTQIASRPGQGDLGPPAVQAMVHRDHGDELGAALTRPGEPHTGGDDLVVAVAEDGRLDRDRLPGDRPRRPAPAVHLRPDALDDDAPDHALHATTQGQGVTQRETLVGALRGADAAHRPTAPPLAPTRACSGNRFPSQLAVFRVASLLARSISEPPRMPTHPWS